MNLIMDYSWKQHWETAMCAATVTDGRKSRSPFMTQAWRTKGSGDKDL